MVKPAEIDPALLSCAPDPKVPPPPVTNKQGAKYVNDLKFAGGDCRSKLGQVQKIQKETVK